MKYTLYIFIFILIVPNEGKAQDVLGRWYSKTIVNDNEVHYLFDIGKKGEKYVGYIDLLSDSIFRIGLDSVSYLNNDSVAIIDKGLDILFKGNFANKEITGILERDGYSNLVSLSREPRVKRNQLIRKPVPYRTKDIYFYNKDSTRLAGTITYPEAGKNLKVVVLISGSGPQNRDEEILGHKPFLVLADYLSRRGVVVLRYDDRGYGESKGQFRPATSMDYSYDALAAVEYLKDYKEIPINQIGLIGHSEGGNIAPVVATLDTAVKFLVLLAAPGTSNLASYLSSLDLILKEYPETYHRDFPFFKSVYEDMANIDDKKILKDSLELKFNFIANLMGEEELVVYGGKEKYIESQVNYHTSDWYHYYLQFDVSEYLQKLKIPVLALNGDKDNSVESTFNLKGIETTLKESGNFSYEIVELENVNHFFQVSDDAKIGSVYFNEETFSKMALNIIEEWISRR